MKIKQLTPHAKRQLWERYKLRDLPEGSRIFICSESTNRKLYRIGDVYLIWAKRTSRVVTFITKEMAEKTAKYNAYKTRT